MTSKESFCNVLSTICF